MSTILFGYWYLILIYSVESYEYGYHPSSEEFDSQVRGQTWTRDLLWREKNNKRFSPKFNLQKPRDAPFNTDPERNPHHVSSSSENENKFLGYAESDTIALPSESVAEVNLNSFSNEKVSLHNDSIFPIYFTNPSTGIVYAITEVGTDTGGNNSAGENGSIPIFVSKEQYERDMYLLKKTYETKCVRQRKPQSDGGNIVKNVKTKLTVHTNRTHVSGGSKRKNRHRKAKKRKTLPKIMPENKPTNPSEATPPLDTQLEKPNKVSVPSVFSKSSPASRPRINSTLSRIKGVRKPQPAKPIIHKVARRSLISEGKETGPNIAKPLKNSLNSTDSADKPKKLLSTQIQVTSEYLEPPTVNTRTPKSSIEEDSHKELPQTSANPPCKNTKPVVKDTADDEYEDYYDFDGAAYVDDQSDLDDSEDEETDESPEVKDGVISSEENISDYTFPEGIHQEDDKYQLKKYSKKRIKRRRPYNDEYDDYDDDYDNESDDSVLGLFRGLFMPVQWIMDGIFDRAALMFNREPESESMYNRKPKYPQYTVYNSAANGVGVEENTTADKANSFGSWLGSWFGLRKRRGVSTTPSPVEDEPGWIESWFGYDVKTPSPEEEESDPWFFGWFNSKPRAKRTTTTTTTTPMPILTIAEPLKNPHKWIGLLAQHIVNSTSTLNPIAETTTDNPDIPKKIAYDKYQIWRLKPNDDAEVKVLDEYKRSEEGVRMQWLKGPTLRGFTDVLIPPKLLIDFQGTLNFENIAHEILIFDVGKVISYEEAKQDDMIRKKPGTGKAVMSWNRYYDYDSIIKYLELTQLRNPQYVELIHIGRSFEGRPLVIAKLEMKKPKEKVTTKKKIKLSKKSDQANSVFIEAGIHGREWISPATATWMINELLKIMKNNRTNVETEYIKNTTWYIMPLSNPDGYEYSHQYDRFWKKSRSRHIAKPNGIINSAMTWLKNKKSEKVCFGVDLDHNWNYNWGKKGSSKSPCNEFFSGPTPFSEPETRTLSKFLMDNRKQIKLFISLQAYGQIISYPNKLNSSFQAQKLDDLLDVAMVGTDGLRKGGSKSRYKVDSMNDLIENKSGSSDYFAAFEVGIPFAYTIHLADNGVHGFLLPSTYIEPTARDTFEIITAMIDYI